MNRQDESGCFANTENMDLNNMMTPIRVKRTEIELKNKCLLHFTAVGIMAMVVNLRDSLVDYFDPKIKC